VETDTGETKVELPPGFLIVDIPTGGRPKKAFYIDGKEVKRDIFELRLANPVAIPVQPPAPTPILKPKGMDAESFSEFCRLAAPDLVQRMYELAKQSEDIRAIAIVAKELSDRAWGKSVQAVQVSVDSRVREAWNIIDVKEIGDESSQRRVGGHGGEPPEADDSVEGKPDTVH
jgi:hypothetical protein